MIDRRVGSIVIPLAVLSTQQVFAPKVAGLAITHLRQSASLHGHVERVPEFGECHVIVPIRKQQVVVNHGSLSLVSINPELVIRLAVRR